MVQATSAEEREGGIRWRAHRLRTRAHGVCIDSLRITCVLRNYSLRVACESTDYALRANDLRKNS